jgi:hypothetical protein
MKTIIRKLEVSGCSEQAAKGASVRTIDARRDAYDCDQSREVRLVLFSVPIRDGIRSHAH